MVNAPVPDERSVMTYVSAYYHVFAGARKTEQATNRISNLIRTNKEIEELEDEYKKLSSDLLSWIEQKLSEFSETEPLKTLSDGDSLKTNLKVYLNTDKPEKLKEKARLETTYLTLMTKLRLKNRQSIDQDSDLVLTPIVEKWALLEKTDKQFQAWLLQEIRRLRQLDGLLKSFNLKCTNVEQWVAGKQDINSSQVSFSDTLAEVRALAKKHEAFESDMNAQLTRLNQAKVLVKKIEDLKYYDSDSINTRYSDDKAKWEQIKEAYTKREAELAHVLDVLEKIDVAYLKFAKQAAPFKILMQNTEEDLQDMPNIDSMSEIQRLSDEHQVFTGSLSEWENKKSSIQTYYDDVLQLKEEHEISDLTDNPYTSITPEELSNLWTVVIDLSKKRSTFLTSEQERMDAVDKLCQDFANLAHSIDTLVNQHQSQLAEKAVKATGSLEEQLESLNNLQASFMNERNKMEELENFNHYSINAMENQILFAKTKGISPEQMNELHRSFAHFDVDNSHRLDPNEFKACLVSLGHNFAEDKKDDTEFVGIMKQVDPADKGYVTLDAFIDYMTREQANLDTEEGILESFKTMAGEKGYVTEADVRQHLSPEDANYCLTNMSRLNGPEGDSGALDYVAFAAKCYGRSL